MTEQILIALENVLKDSERLEHLQLHFSSNKGHLQGSTFNKDFVENSFELIRYISVRVKKRNFKLKINENELVLIINDQDKIVGFDALMAIQDLTNEEQKRIIVKKRFGFDVKSLEKEANETSVLRAIFRKNEIYELKTIFPGTYAPPFPMESTQSMEEFKLSTVFWDEHILLF